MAVSKWSGPELWELTSLSVYVMRASVNIQQMLQRAKHLKTHGVAITLYKYSRASNFTSASYSHNNEAPLLYIKYCNVFWDTSQPVSPNL